MDKKKRQEDMAGAKPVAAAAKALIRSMYVHGDVAEYVAGKYDIKGGDRDWKRRYRSR